MIGFDLEKVACDKVRLAIKKNGKDYEGLESDVNEITYELLRSLGYNKYVALLEKKVKLGYGS